MLWSAGPSPEAPRRSPELALALPSAYQQDPQELLGMQHALFGTADDAYPGRNKRPKSGKATTHLPDSIQQLVCTVYQAMLWG